MHAYILQQSMEKLAKNINLELIEKNKWFLVTREDSQPDKGN